MGETCLLCGINIVGTKRRFQNKQATYQFILQRCSRTPFVYSFLTCREPRPDGKHALCIPCVNWKRRAETCSLRRTRRPLLQLDQLILYLMQPGKFQEPDQRCFGRLMQAIRQPKNPLGAALPLPVATIVQSLRGNTTHDAVLAWWEYNGRTEFFRHAEEAKRVRTLVKLGLD